MDGEQHRCIREILSQALTQVIKQVPLHIRQYAQGVLAPIRRAGEMEFVTDFASPISLFTIAHVLGIPTDDLEELRQLERWSDAFADLTTGYFRRNTQDIRNLEEYFRYLVAKKRRSPSNDLLSAFIGASDVFADEDSLIANCMMVFSAGRTDTKRLLGNGISLLMPLWEQLQTDFREQVLSLRQVSEEMLRMVTPTRCVVREACQQVDLSAEFPGNHEIRSGQKMLLFLEAANFDPSVFQEPRQFNPQRRPNKHLAFGYGRHQCPGAPLARLEIQIALEELLSLTRLRPKPGLSPTWSPNPVLGGFATNPVVFEADL